MCAYLFAMRIFRSRDHEPSQYAQGRVGFNRLNFFDHDRRTSCWRAFYGSSSEASFRHCVWRKFNRLNSKSMSSFAFTHCNVAERVANWKDLWSAEVLQPRLQNYTAMLMFQQISYPWRAATVWGFPTTTEHVLDYFVFPFTKITLFRPSDRLSH